MPEFYTWAILLINQLDEFVKSNFQFLAIEGAKIAPKCMYPFVNVCVLFDLGYSYLAQFGV